MLTRPSRLLTLLLMLPLWAFAQAVLVLRILPFVKVSDLQLFGGKYYDPIYAAVLLSLALIAAIGASFVASRRAATLGWRRPGLLGLLIHIPFIGAGLALWLAASGDEEEGVSSAPTAVAGRLVMPFILILVIGLGLTAGLGYLQSKNLLPFGLKNTGGYFGLAVFLGVPFAAGVSASVVVRRAGGSFGQAAGASLTLIGTLLLILCAGLMEGIVCVLMAAPFGAALALLGCVAGGFLVRSPASDGRLHSMAWLGVVALAAFEGWNPPAPLEDRTTTEIIINAPTARVWAELHDIRNLPPTDNLLFQYGVAHPLGTVTDGTGVGAARLCQLSTGDMPEIISVWKPNEELRFKVLSTPPAMKELGFFGQTIDAAHLHSAYTSLEGGFKLEPLPGGRTRLIGESRYVLNLAPATYWNLWTREIVHAVHRRVLEHVKTRAEAAPRP